MGIVQRSVVPMKKKTCNSLLFSGDGIGIVFRSLLPKERWAALPVRDCQKCDSEIRMDNICCVHLCLQSRDRD